MLRTALCFQPERIDPSASRQGYDVRSDVWSLGITLVRQTRAAASLETPLELKHSTDRLGLL